MPFLRRSAPSSNKSVEAEKGWTLRSLVGRVKEKRAINLEGTLVIGIDFGTTYSGVAWATIADFESDQINLIQTWPGIGGERGKAPTEIDYENGTSWGFAIPSDGDPIKWFKLLLLRDEDLSEEIRNSEFLIRARRKLKQLNKTAVDVVADYLRALWSHILETIQKARSQAVVEALKFHVVITVPAIWKSYARSAMEQAAQQAGIITDRLAGQTTLGFAPEPEAAAIATLWDQSQDINTDDVYVICDAGGGTVDLISYRVGSPFPIELHEAVIGTGKLCGGIFIDEAFEAMCKRRLGRRWSKLSQTGIKEIMRDEWEHGIKTEFSNDAGKSEYIVPIPAEAFKDSSQNDNSEKPIIKNGRIHFSSSDIAGVFAQVFSEIGKLVDEQIAQTKKSRLKVKGIVLVGGLGSSPYLYEYLNERYRSKPFDVLQASGVKPRTAICRGAIYKGFLGMPEKLAKGSLPLDISSTIARQSLGIEVHPVFKEGVHLESDKYWDKIDCCHRAANQMDWYIKKGQNVEKGKPISGTLRYIFESKKQFEEFTSQKVMQCDLIDSPTRLTSDVKKFCSITPNLDNMSYDSLEDYHAKCGKILKTLSLKIEMVPSGASYEFSLYDKDQKLGSNSMEMEF